MKASTITIMAIGGLPILWEVAVLLRERLFYPYRIDDIGLPWAELVVAVAAGILAIGCIKSVLDHLGKRQ